MSPAQVDELEAARQRALQLWAKPAGASDAADLCVTFEIEPGPVLNNTMQIIS